MADRHLCSECVTNPENKPESWMVDLKAERAYHYALLSRKQNLDRVWYEGETLCGIMIPRPESVK